MLTNTQISESLQTIVDVYEDNRKKYKVALAIARLVGNVLVSINEMGLAAYYTRMSFEAMDAREKGQADA